MKPGKILNSLALPLLYLVSILPFPIFYLLSDFLFVIIFYVWQYRKKIAFDNLRISFPRRLRHLALVTPALETQETGNGGLAIVTL
jgi:lauroyl/myristoyl acyltransferase